MNPSPFAEELGLGVLRNGRALLKTNGGNPYVKP
jgi:hypothetical protein